MKIDDIWSEYHLRLLGFIKQRVTEKDAEDVLQDVFVKIHSRLDRLDEKAKIESWIFQITRNTVIDYYRSKKPTEPLPDWLECEAETDLEELKQELCWLMR